MFRLVRWLLLLVGLGLLAPASWLWGQGKILNVGDTQERLSFSTPELEDWNKNQEYKEFQDYLKGGPRPADEVFNHAAEWYAYRLSRNEYQEPKPGGKTMHDLYREALETFDPKYVKAKQDELLEVYGKRLMGRLALVVKNPKVIARVNAARLLGRLAAQGLEETTEVLVGVLEDPKENDAVKYYALMGIKDFFAYLHTEGRDRSRFRNQRLEAHCIDALLKYVKHKPNLPPDAPSEQVAAISWVRGEAIAALGQTRFPGLMQVNDRTKVAALERPTALILLRVLRKDGFTPPPSLSEQVAAVVSVSQLKGNLCREFRTDYAAHLIGSFLAEFVEAYDGTAEPKKGEPIKDAWKINAARLNQALLDLKANAAEKEYRDYVDKLVVQATPILAEVTAGKRPAPRAEPIRTWLDQNKPKANVVYDGIPTSEVKGGE
jgi:hypothetical protein